MFTEMQPVVGMELVDLQAALGSSEPAFRARQIYDAVYRLRVTDLGSISLSKTLVKLGSTEACPLCVRALSCEVMLCSSLVKWNFGRYAASLSSACFWTTISFNPWS